ncbi:alkaline phosphatase [Nakamurella sp. DB0629]|uniref:Alkaline phosphatase n=1 Tax=Nakamurella aerolata TaxID=1656892 RepID=A0A849A720_9ACTN|nr:alkaline phosphatase [Nakamurella aerolata]NNG34908.1 alkaline phosphatase [Nakamurella aerolata]
MSIKATSVRRRTVVVGVATAMAAAAVATPVLAARSDSLADHGGATRLDGDNTNNVRQAIKGGKARNVILLIGDGMGSSELTIARNYEYGAAGRLPGLDSLPLSGQYTTYSLTKAGKPDYDPDSASTGSAWATGTKTYDGAISVDIKGAPQKSMLEIAKANGLRTGNVSTAEIQDATPAVQMAHVTARSCYGPSATLKTCSSNAIENGGAGSITEQIINTRADVTLGGGAATFNEKATAGKYAGQTLLDQATSRGYQVVNNKAGLDAVTAANQDQPLLGLFSSGNMPVRWVGPESTTDGGKKDPARCQPNPARPDTQPSLADMTSKAIELLQAKQGKGFFLQVEGASIDKQDHAANACGQIGETIDLDEAVQAAMDFAKRDGNTTVLVTADHSHTSQIVEAGSVTPGLTANLLTNEGSPMTINYATAAKGGSQQHTGAELPVVGYGPQAANVVGLIDQTDMFFIMSRALGLQSDPAELSKNAKVTVAPRSPKAGAGVVVEASKFYGDTSVRSTMVGGGNTVDLGVTELNNGAATGYGTAPSKPGKYQLEVTGEQSGKKVTLTVQVR